MVKLLLKGIKDEIRIVVLSNFTEKEKKSSASC